MEMIDKSLRCTLPAPAAEDLDMAVETVELVAPSSLPRADAAEGWTCCTLPADLADWALDDSLSCRLLPLALGCLTAAGWAASRTLLA